MKHLSIIVCIFLFCIQLCSYGQSLVLKGSVVDQNNLPVPYASVALMDKEGDSLITGTISDATGAFSFSTLSEGEYTLSVSFLGYKSFRTLVALRKEQEIKCLLVEDNVALNEVVVEANRSSIVRNSAVGQTFMLSKSSMKKKDIMLALQEIPALSIDTDLRKITMADGGKPLILINGVRRDGGISALNPEDILSVDVIQSVSAEFMREGYTSVVNIKAKKSDSKYKLVNAGINTHPAIRFGIADFSFETGGNNASFYASAQSFAFLNNKSDLCERTATANYLRELSSRRNSHYNETDVSVGGDKWWSGRDYSSYSFTLHYMPQSSEASGTSVLTENDKEEADTYTHRRELDNKTYAGSVNVYHKHTLGNQSVMDVLLKLSYSKNSNEVSQREESGKKLSLRNYDFLNNRLVSFLTASYRFRLAGFDLKLGTSTQYQYNRIKENASEFSSFKHKEWSEYLFMNVNRKWDKFSLAASAGVDAVFRSVESYHENYGNMRCMLGLNYQFNSCHSVGFNYNMHSYAPAITDLNPYDYSSDTLTVSKGNPSLKPYHVHKFRLTYGFSKGKVYLSPFAAYQQINDAIVATGEEQGAYYVKSLANQGKSTLFTCGANTRYSIGKLGHVGLLLQYNHITYSTIGQKNDYFSGRLYGGLTYKKVGVNMSYSLPSHSYEMYTHSYSTPESNLRLTYNASERWDVSLGMRYVASMKHVKKWINMPGYAYYFDNDFTNRGNIIMLGVRYKFYDNNRKKSREQNKLQNEEKGFNIIAQ